MPTKLIVISLLLAMLIALLALCPVLPVSAQSATATWNGTATVTYTPIPTRTPGAGSPGGTVIQTGGGGTATFDPSMTAGDAFIVTAIAALLALGALAWTYEWVKSHIRVQEQ